MSYDSEDGRPKRKKNGQFAKGFSGNTNGRPRSLPRAQVPAQLARDIMAEMEAPVRILNAKGKEEEIPYMIAAIRAMKADVLKTRDMRKFEKIMSMYVEALTQNAASMPRHMGLLEQLETAFSTAATVADQQVVAPFLANARLRTRST